MKIKNLKTLTEKQRNQISSYYNYAIRVSGNLGENFVSASDDVRSVVHFAIIEAIIDYDHSKKISLPTYIGYIVRNRIKDKYRLEQKRSNRYEQIDINKCTGNKYDPWNIDTIDFFDWLTNDLDDISKDLIVSVFIDKMKIFQFARIRNIRSEKINKIYKKSISLMKKRYFEVSLESLNDN